jgi:hypothetical protein
VDYKWLWRENLGGDLGKWIPYDESQNRQLEAEWRKKNSQVKQIVLLGVAVVLTSNMLLSLVVDVCFPQR